MISVHAYPIFELSNGVSLLAKTAAREQKLGPCPEIPYWLPPCSWKKKGPADTAYDCRGISGPTSTVALAAANSKAEREASLWGELTLPVTQNIFHIFNSPFLELPVLSYLHLLVRLGLPPTEWVQFLQKSRDHGGSSSTSIPGSNEMALYRRSGNTDFLKELQSYWSVWMWTWGNVLGQSFR